MPLTFDPTNKRIILDSAATTAVAIYSSWVDWVAVGDNAKYGEVMRTAGGDDLGGGLSIPPYIFLKDGWRVRPMEANHNLTITGNLFVEGGGVPVVPTLGVFQVNVNYTVPVQAQAIATGGSTGPTASEIANAVWSKALETMTAEQMMRIMLSALAGKRQGLGTSTEIHYGQDGTTPRITFSADAEGNGTPILNGAQ